MPGDESKLTRQILRVVFIWGPAAVFACGVITAVSALAFAHLGVIIGPIMAMFLGYSIFHFIKAMSRRRGMAIVSYVETAVRLNLPLDAYLLAAQRSETGVVRERLELLRELISRGTPIGVALMMVREIPVSVASAAAAAEPLGQLQPTLTRIVAEESRLEETRTDKVPFYKFYPLVIGAMVFTLVTGFMVFIVPKFREIFKDFNVNLPFSTKLLLQIADVMVNQTPLAAMILILMFLAFMVVLGLLLERSFGSATRGSRISLIDNFFWYAPVVRGLARNRSMSQICRFLSDATRAAIPLPTALDGAAGLYLNQRARDKVVLWRDALREGRTSSQGAAAATMPPLVVSLLDNAQAPRAGGEDNTSNVFDFLGRYYGARFSRLWILIQATYEPLILLALGLLVGFVTHALFHPLVVLIDSVMRYYPEVGL